MDKKFYKNTYRLKNNRVLVYQRSGSTQYQCRLKITGVSGYIIKSCKTSLLEDAIRVAERLYDELNYRAVEGLPVKTKTFEEVYEEWLKTIKVRKSKARIQFYEGRGKLYFIPYFGKYKIDVINTSIVDGYWNWRLEYYNNNPTKITIHTHKRPSYQSLRMEKCALKEFFRYAYASDYMRKIPEIIYRIPAISNRRDSFTHQELATIEKYLWDEAQIREIPLLVERTKLDMNNPEEMKKYVEKLEEEEKKQEAKQYPVVKKHILHQRRMLWGFVCFLALTGLRVGEARKLKWKHIEVLTNEKGKTLYIHITPNNKTGERWVISTPAAYDVIFYLLPLTKYNELDDYVFSNYRDGSMMKHLEQSFVKVLKKIKLYYSETGKPRPLYSLRHYYATERIKEGNVDIYLLAKNMGTSVQQIEQHYGHIIALQKANELTQGAMKTPLGIFNSKQSWDVKKLDEKAKEILKIK